MDAPGSSIDLKGLRGWWTSPPRSGMRLIISPFEYRHLRGSARVRIAGGIVLAGLGVVTLAYGGNDARRTGGRRRSWLPERPTWRSPTGS